MNDKQKSEEAEGGGGEGGGGREGGSDIDDFYRRRLDRSPEKKEFYQLPETDRRLICDLRSAMHAVYEKFTKLRDQVSEREADETTEPRTMPDLKLEDLVDMYGDPAVNDELRRRLSRSSKGDPKATLAHPIMPNQGDDFSRDKRNRHRSLELEDFEISLKKENRKRQSLNRRQRGSGRRVNRSATESDDEVAARRASSDADKMFHPAHASAASFGNFPNHGFFPPFYPWAPASMAAPFGPQQSHFPPPVVPGCMAPPYAYPFGVIGPMPYVYPPASNLGPPHIQLDHEVPVRDTSDNVKQQTAEQEMVQQAKESSTSNLLSQGLPNADAGHDLIMSFAQQSMSSPGDLKSSDEVNITVKNDDIHTSSARIHEHCPVCAEVLGYSSQRAFNSSLFSHKPTVIYVPESSESKRYVVRKTARRFGRNLTGSESMESRQLHITSSFRQIGMSGLLEKPLRGSISQKLDRQISVLLEELERSKDLNIQLQDELIAAEQELDSMRFILQNKDAEIRSQATGKLAVMVQDIYRAQKERDVAMMNRINRANAERDEALLQLKRLQQKYSRSTIKSDPSSVEEMKLNEILTSLQSAMTSDSIDNRGMEIVEAIKRMKEQRWQTAAEEMRAILEERDMAFAKCKDLEAELSQMRTKIHDVDACRQQRQVLQGKLFATEHERNLAMEKISQLEEEMLSLKVYYNLHGSLSQEVSLYQQFSQTLDRVERELRAKEEEMEVLRRDREQLLDQLKDSSDEKKLLAEELGKSHEDHVAECLKTEKLQRLVNVLRRKINGFGIKSDEPE